MIHFSLVTTEDTLGTAVIQITPHPYIPSTLIQWYIYLFSYYSYWITVVYFMLWLICWAFALKLKVENHNIEKSPMDYVISPLDYTTSPVVYTILLLGYATSPVGYAISSVHYAITSVDYAISSADYAISPMECY